MRPPELREQLASRALRGSQVARSSWATRARQRRPRRPALRVSASRSSSHSRPTTSPRSEKRRTDDAANRRSARSPRAALVDRGCSRRRSRRVGARRSRPPVSARASLRRSPRTRRRARLRVRSPSSPARGSSNREGLRSRLSSSLETDSTSTPRWVRHTSRRRSSLCQGS